MAVQAPIIDKSGTVEFAGAKDKPAFLLLHGFATSPLDLVPIAEVLSARGYTCRLPVLPGHGVFDRLEDATYREWRTFVSQECAELALTHPRVFVIGFSLGATIALGLGNDLAAEAVVGISAFVEPSQKLLARLLLQLSRVRRLPRILQTTKRRSQDYLYGRETIPPEAADEVLEAGRVLARSPSILSAKTLLIHSIDDRVASYAATAGFAIAHPRVCVVSLAGLNHFLQFDVSPVATVRLILSFVGLESPGEPLDKELLAERMTERDADARHWSDTVFRLILAFFTVFGALLFFSLEDVFNETERAPTFLMAYVGIISFYVLLASLYFFYLVRVDVYSRTLLDPLDQPFGWTLFRTTEAASGAASTSMTRRTSVAVVALPLLSAPAIWFYAVANYWDGDFGPSADNMFHWSLALITALVWLLALASATTLGSYTRRHLYGRLPVACYPQIRSALDTFLLAVEPGSVRPNLTPQSYLTQITQRGTEAHEQVLEERQQPGLSSKLDDPSN